MKKIGPVIFMLLLIGFSCKKEKEVTHEVKLIMQETSAYHPQYLICYGVSSNGVTACYNDTVNAYQYEEAAAKTGFKVRMELTCNDPHHDFTLKYFLDGNLVQSFHMDSTRTSGSVYDELK